MTFLKEILNELYAVGTRPGRINKSAPPPNLPSVWSTDAINRVEIAANQENRLQRQQSHVRNDELPDNLGHTVSDYGDIRSGDDNEMRGYDGYSDGPQEYEEEIGGEFCHACGGEGVDDRGDTCVKCGGRGEVGQDGRYVDAEEQEEDECERCYGLGHTPSGGKDCPECGGSGTKSKVGQEEQEDDAEQGPVGADIERAPTDEISDEQIDDQYGEADPDGENEFADDVEQEWDDPNLQGVIRTVPNSHLIYKRQQEDGTFNELWQYSIGDDFRKELEVRRSILAGTDIPPNKMSSPDNTQSFELWTAGNAQVMHVRGLPN